MDKTTQPQQLSFSFEEPTPPQLLSALPQCRWQSLLILWWMSKPVQQSFTIFVRQ